jgi:hypothetical protein
MYVYVMYLLWFSGWIWAYYISYYTWAMRGLMINEQKGLIYDCPPAPAPCLYPNGDAALELYGMDGAENEKWFCILWMGLFFVGFNCAAALCMTYVTATAVDHEEEPNFQPVHTIEEDQNLYQQQQNIKIIPNITTSPSPQPTTGDHLNGTATNSDFGEVPMNTHAPVSEQGESAHDSLISNAPANPATAATAVSSNQSAVTVSPSVGGCVSWHNLCYTVTTPEGDQKKLLDNVLGFAKPGMLVSLMGASGSGKTSKKYSTAPCLLHTQCEHTLTVKI